MTLPPLAIPDLLRTPGPCPQFTQQFFVRMVFSALCDADFLETERFHAPDAPRGHPGSLADLAAALTRHMARFGPARPPVNRLRAEVLEAAAQTAAAAPGFFSLTVPTGGGKTLASLRFALDHAVRHDLRRVIHIAPFTAIIEQTAEVFRTALGDPDAVLEHHTGFDLDRDLPETEAERMRLAAQNWDRPVVVTTAVQFYESLFANRTQKCRKLHNIARSVGGRPYPVEYKRGRPKAHRADEVQLCAQALCLEEMCGAAIPEGALFYGQTRRRVVVPFDAACAP